ncbi:MAG: hypothetical protein IH986_16745 [Planctomycetes bacterium]|nr:hypothetical protein [Planctomycetota bacterium]
MKTSATRYVGVLADSSGNVVTIAEVQEYGQRDALQRGAAHNFQEWTLSVRAPSSGERVRQVVLRQGLASYHTQAFWRAIENIEARADSSGRRIWLVNRQTRRVVASADLDAESFTGPDDEPPPWARPDGGTVLTSITKVLYDHAD